MSVQADDLAWGARFLLGILRYDRYTGCAFQVDLFGACAGPVRVGRAPTGENDVGGTVPRCVGIGRLWLLFGIGIKAINPRPPTGGHRGAAPSTWSKNMS